VMPAQGWLFYLDFTILIFGSTYLLLIYFTARYPITIKKYDYAKNFRRNGYAFNQYYFYSSV
ncbi:MAG: hypothetical protein ACK55K_03375, partial [Bacteroidota bacterium]